MIFSERKEGLKIVDVQSGSPGFDAGLKNGDIVLEIEGKKIKSLPGITVTIRKLLLPWKCVSTERHLLKKFCAQFVIPACF